MKRGFTLVELIGVIVLIAAIALIVIPVVDGNIKQGKKDLYDQQIENVEIAAQLWYSNNKLNLSKDEHMTITLGQLKFEKLIDLNISNPVKDEFFPNDMLINIKNADGRIIYEILTDTGTDKSSYSDDTPEIILNGDVLQYVQLNRVGIYTELGVSVADKSGNEIPYKVDINPQIDLSKKGVYNITYSASNNGTVNSAIRTVIVKDTQAPNITFPVGLSVPLASVNSYDYKSDIKITDNSDDEVSVKVETNFGVVPGVYTIKYIATDSSGNEATFLRKINVTS